MQSHTGVGCVCFDCDSTLSTIEGIDELAVAAGREREVAPLTAAAMNGELAIEEVYARRLELLRPNRSAIDWLGRRYVETLVAGARETVRWLVAREIPVYIVSGGLKPAILPLATALAIAPQRLVAVDVTIDGDGQYRDFDRASPLVRSDGKARVTAMLAARHGRTVLVGDGVTDVAARASGAFVIGFGGVARRAAVVAAADAFVDGPSLFGVIAVVERLRGPAP